MDDESNMGSGNIENSASVDNAKSVAKNSDELSTLDDGDIPMNEADNETSEPNHLLAVPPPAQSEEDIQDTIEKATLTQNGSVENNNCNSEPTQMEEDVTAGTSSTSKSSTSLRRPAGSKPKTNRFAKRNYRKPILSSSSSSSSNRSTPEPQIGVGSRESNIQSNTVNHQSSDADNDEGDIDVFDWEANDDNDDDDDDDDDSSSYGFNLSQVDESDSDESASTKAKSDADSITNAILKTQKPSYKQNLLTEIISREHGLSPHSLKTVEGRSSLAFLERIYGARQTIERLKLLHALQEHEGCVNSLNFHKSGNLLASGSDDLKIILWDWASNKIKYSLNSGHHSNVFQTKFLDFGASPSDIHIVSSGRDGQVRYITIPPGGTSADAQSRVLLKHSGSVHKISPTPHNPYEVLTAGEDGNVFRCDLRDNLVEKVCAVKRNIRRVPLYSIAHSPHEPHFCVCGRDRFVRVYDKRSTSKPLFTMCPEHLDEKKCLNSHITCAVYNSSGSEILASYSDECIYSFTTKCYLSGKYRHRYRGHNNHKTIKGVNYFGLNSEYVVSGSDCGNFFIWDSESEAILNWRKADHMGVVNCLEPHPSFPVLATSGLDHDVKIWAPTNEKYPPAMEGLEKCLKYNTKKKTGSNLFDDRTLYFFMRQCLRNRRLNPGGADCPTIDDFSTSDSDDNTNDCDPNDNLQLQSFPPCNPQ